MNSLLEANLRATKINPNLIYHQVKKLLAADQPVLVIIDGHALSIRKYHQGFIRLLDKR